MQRMTIHELSTQTGVVRPRLVRAWKEGRPVDGKTIRSEEVDGERLWWLEGDESSDSAPRDIPQDIPQPLTLERAKELRLDGGPAAVDVADLSEEDAAAFKAWLPSIVHKEEGPPADQEKEDDTPTSELTAEWLTSIDGIGKTGAEKLLAECEERGIRTFAALGHVEDLTELPAIGKVNGENLRAELEEKLANMPALEPAPTVDTTVEQDFHPIHCPYCGDIFDEVEAGVYQTDWALCVSEDGAVDVGDCGRKFQLIAEPDGYRTEKLEPEADIEPCPHCGEDREPNVFGRICKAEGCGKDVERLAERADAAGEEVAPGVHRHAKDGEVRTVEHELGGEVGEDEPAPNSPGDVGFTDVMDATADDMSIDEASDLANGIIEKMQAPTILPMSDRIHPALPSCRLLGRADHDTDDWHALRAAGIGSSDAGAILGLSPHATAVDVWRTKVGEETDRKPWLEGYSWFGQWFEPFIRRWCEEEHAIEIIDGAELGTLQSADWPHALANIDGLDVTSGTVEEYKTTSKKWSEPPVYYVAQCQEQMLVTGADEVRLRQFVCPISRELAQSLLEKMRGLAFMDIEADRALADWLLEHGEVHTWIIERDERFIARLLSKMKTFWQFVELEIEPPIPDPDGTVDLTDDPEVYAACVEYARLSQVTETYKPDIKEAEAAKKKAKKAIEKAVSLLEDPPKRLTIGPHKATLVQREKYSYWNIYTDGEGDDVIPF